MAKSLHTLAEMADQLHLTREKRLALQKEVDALQSEETALRSTLIQSIKASDATGVSGSLVRVTVVTKQKPRVADWDALYTYITRRRAYDLLQRRLSDTAVKERWDDGKEIPGVESYEVEDLSMNKVK